MSAASVVLTPPYKLHLMELVLPLAAWQRMEHIATPLRLAVSDVRRRFAVERTRKLVVGLAMVRQIPAEARWRRIAWRAAWLLVGAVEEERPGAERFVDNCWAEERDPALVIAQMAERLIQRLLHIPEGLRKRRKSCKPRPKPLVRLTCPVGERLDRQAQVFARAFRDEVLAADGWILQQENKALLAAAPAQQQALRDRMLKVRDPYITLHRPPPKPPSDDPLLAVTMARTPRPLLALPTPEPPPTAPLRPLRIIGQPHLCR